MTDTLLIYAAVIAVPILLLALQAAFAWRYRRIVRDSIADSSATAPTTLEPVAQQQIINRPPLVVIRTRATDSLVERAAAANLRADADATTRRVQRAIVAAGVVYWALLIIGLSGAFASRIPLDARLTALYLTVAPVLLIVLAVLSPAPMRVATIAVGYVITGILVMHGFASTSRIMVLVNAERDFFLVLPLAGLVLLTLRRLRPLLVALGAIALYLLIVTVLGAVVSESRVSLDGVRWWVWPIGILNLLLGLIVFAWLLGRESVRWPVAALVAAGGAGLLIEAVWKPAFPIGAIIGGLPSNVLQLYLLWLIFRLIVWFHDRHLLPGQILHSHVLFAFLSAYFLAVLYTSRGTSFFGEKIWPLALIAAAFVCHAIVLHGLLRRIWADRQVRPGKRLLFLRAFGSTKGRERLLDALEDSWRRVGRIDLIGATDLALHTLGSRMLEAFLLQRVAKQFLKTDDDVIRRLGQLRSPLEGDARYPVNEVYCQGNTWQRAVRELAASADAILMDVRGLTIRNKGCAFELRELVRRVLLRRIVLLADRTTDMQALEQIARTAWLDVPAESPNAVDSSPHLKVLHYEARPRDAKALIAMLFDAAVESERDVLHA